MPPDVLIMLSSHKGVDGSEVATDLKQVVTLLGTFQVPWQWTYHGTLLHPGVAQFAFGFYSVEPGRKATFPSF